MSNLYEVSKAPLYTVSLEFGNYKIATDILALWIKLEKIGQKKIQIDIITIPYENKFTKLE